MIICISVFYDKPFNNKKIVSSNNHTNLVDAEKVFAISEINRIVKNILLSHLEKVWIGGEVSNFVEASSGHWYFSLKDSSAQIRCTMFKGYNTFSSISPKNGDQIEAFGAVSLYEARGDYQINIEQIREKGTGNLFEKFLQLKDKLEKLGLFDEENKLNIPTFPKNIGIITSASGAALRDVLSILNKEQNYNQIIIYPSSVQGKEAADEICSAINKANAHQIVDVLILCRGGGSIEDLWSFNEEKVVQAIAQSRLPIISGVGHETDFTLTDFVADMRAPTPTAAASVIQDRLSKLDEFFEHYLSTLQKNITNLLKNKNQELDYLEKRIVSPKDKLKRSQEFIDSLKKQFITLLRKEFLAAEKEINSLHKRLLAPQEKIKQAEEKIKNYKKALLSNVFRIIKEHQSKINFIDEKLNILNPKNILAKGYSIVYNKTDVVKDSNKVNLNDTLDIQLHSGALLVQVKNNKKH
ncbi:MAG: exodeoxyribonuclease VII large subunit [Betaproteobacteria bacterium]|nr:exodeoxyribonuclease VII large subunit [Betaproteobacteria bacterium]NCX67548.1 exodeoxyribonuclease VII large subunit [Betaproteobacteria bacterium]